MALEIGCMDEMDERPRRCYLDRESVAVMAEKAVQVPYISYICQTRLLSYPSTFR